MSLASPPRFSIAARQGGRIDLNSDGEARAHIFVLEDDILRVLVRPNGSLPMSRTWAIAPGAEDCPVEGRDRFDIAGFSLPAFDLAETEGVLTLTAARVRLTVRLDGFFCAWEIRDGDAWLAVAADRPTQAYDFGYWDGKPTHFLARSPGERYFGLGERAGPMDRAGRRYRLSNTDAMGYDAALSDPLYKHIPFAITQHVGGAAFGLFYDTLADCEFDFGCEISNYHGPYRSFRAEAGDLDYYFIAGPAIADIPRRFTWLTGRPAMPPKWALGYSGSSMSYTDDMAAQIRLAEFLADCVAHDILCDSFHLSSGYSSIDSRRHVFHWNPQKFTDPARLAADFHAAGIRLIANVKPCLLRDHPRFAEAAALGLFVNEEDANPSWAQFWGDLGAYLDFTNPQAAAWWSERVTDNLLRHGIDATWNDNNEFEITSPNAQAAGFGEPFPAREAKPLQTLLMLRASQAAQRAHAPDKRPFLVTRAGAAGMQRYAQTWSGDNRTSWKTLRYNIRMGLGLALSGVSQLGHDVGGFTGPAPDAELFARWVGCGVFMPRFTIHSWNEDGFPSAPWMHAEAVDSIRSLIKLRASLIPYLYDLSWRYRSCFEPMLRPVFHDFPDDPALDIEGDDFLLGRALLVAPVVETGVAVRDVLLPAGADWWDYWSGGLLSGGRVVQAPAPWDRPPLFVRAGSVIALNVAEQHFASRAERRGFSIWPLRLGAFSQEIFDDDGESEAFRAGVRRLWRFDIACGADKIRVRIDADGHFPDAASEIEILFPEDARPIAIEGGAVETLGSRRFRVKMA